ncbi:hypothetical protein Sango_3047200 [Sesamum angolense]|uniref:Reverse transcriptase zinc-binding domain-containing protein n=1 Tax=Sesamum angolense TaxID=2727404 RepID=A0AAE1TC96_9LAMI|nr:hypothetical protein Sango_3047200 [Sesamum angolense]
MGTRFLFWHDPWHSLGPLITRFPAGQTFLRQQNSLRYLWMELGVGLLSQIWNALKSYTCYRLFTMAPTLFYGVEAASLQKLSMIFSIFPGPKVGWYSLLVGPCKIPRYSFVLWMAILDKLSTMDKPWLSHLGGVCVLCCRELETHEHLFFRCNFSRQCIRILKESVRFSWLNRAWERDINWASRRWNGRHIVQAAYRALLAAIVYHIWQERNRRVFSTLSGLVPLLLE